MPPQTVTLSSPAIFMTKKVVYARFLGNAWSIFLRFVIMPIEDFSINLCKLK